MTSSRIAAALLVLTPFAATAAELKSHASPTRFVCETSLARTVAFTPGCCDGHMRCAQLLSTDMLHRAPARHRT